MVAASGGEWSKQVQVNVSCNLRVTAPVAHLKPAFKKKPKNPNNNQHTNAQKPPHNNFPVFISIITPASVHGCHPLPPCSSPSPPPSLEREKSSATTQRNDIVFNFLILLHFVVNKRCGGFEVFLIALGEINYFPPAEKKLPPPSSAFTSKDFPKGSESQLK